MITVCNARAVIGNREQLFTRVRSQNHVAETIMTTTNCLELRSRPLLKKGKATNSKLKKGKKILSTNYLKQKLVRGDFRYAETKPGLDFGPSPLRQRVLATFLPVFDKTPRQVF